MKTLSTCQKGIKYTIHEIEEGDHSSRMGEMGLFPGVEVKVLFVAPFGDPVALELGSMVLCIRKEDANRIKISRE